MGEFENSFSWSPSRDRSFKECKRRYFYERYGSWGGWNASASEYSKTLYLLKNLKNRWAWRGSLVHEAIEDYLNQYLSDVAGDPSMKKTKESLGNGSLVEEFKTLWQDTKKKMNREWKISEEKQYKDDPKKITGLKEHEYEEAISRSAWKKIWNEVLTSIQNLLSMNSFRNILENPETVVSVEKLEKANLFGYQVYYVFDVLVKENGVYTIIDWKTSSRMSNKANENQLGFYAAVIARNGIDLDKIKVVESNLLLGKEKSYEVSREFVDKLNDYAEASILQMAKYVVDGDLGENVGLEEEAFPMEGPALGICKFCSFVGVCPEGAAILKRNGS